MIRKRQISLDFKVFNISVCYYEVLDVDTDFETVPLVMSEGRLAV